jgi:hypothetical protein
MPQIIMPVDLAAELSEDAHWYAGEPAMEAFLAQVQAGHGWTPRRPRQLLAWAAANAIPVFGCKRFILIMNAGFDGPGRWRLWRMAVTELCRCRVAIARGEESALAYAGRELRSFGDGPARRWGRPTDEFGGEGAMTALVFPSFAGPGPEAAGSTPSSSSSSPGSSAGPQVPHGGWLSR